MKRIIRRRSFLKTVIFVLTLMEDIDYERVFCRAIEIPSNNIRLQKRTEYASIRGIEYSDTC